MINQIRTLLRNPGMRRDYVRYCLSKLAGSGTARRMVHGVEIVGIVSFTDYRSIVQALSNVERHFLNEAVLGDGDIVDVGANYGIWALTLARRFPERQVHAFEPHPEVFRALERTACRSRVMNLRVDNQAVWNTDGLVDFVAHTVGSPVSHVRRTGEAHTFCHAVPCIRLDTYLANRQVRQISLLKIDVEGFESCVLQGAKETLDRKAIGMIVLEVCPGFSAVTGIPARRPLEILSDHGYRLFRLTPVGLCPAIPGEVDHVSLENWVAVRGD